MKITQSIQKRVFLIFGSFTLFLTLVYTGINILLAYVVEDEVLEKVLAYEAQLIENTFKQQGKIIQPRLDYLQLYLKPELAPKEIALAYKNKTLNAEVFTKDNRHYHIQFLYFDEKNRGILVAEVTPFLTVTNASSGIIFLFVSIFFVSIFLSLWLAYRIAKQTTQPISILAKEVMSQQSQNFPVKLSVTQSNDEISYLAYTIEKTLNELKNSIKRESNFNRDVSHELRTPLTVLNNTLSLSEIRALSELDIKQLNHSVNQMNNIVTTLLILARAESVESENLLLRPLLEDCVLALQHKLNKKSLKVKLNVVDSFELKTNQKLLILLVNNLIENAIEYSTGEALIIRLNGECLLFENKLNQNIIPATINDLTEKGIKQSNSSGFGQGLYLVRRIIETLGWEFKINSDAGLFQFSIILKSFSYKAVSSEKSQTGQ